MGQLINRIVPFLLPIILLVLILYFVILYFSQGIALDALLKDYAIPAVIYLTIAGLVIAAIFAVIYTIMNLIYSPKQTIMSILGFIALAAVLFIAYNMATGETIPKHDDVPASTMRLVEGGIFATLILIGIGVVSAVVLELYNAIR